MNRPSEEYMLTHSDEWLQWPYLPMKRWDGKKMFLAIVREGNGGLQLSENNIFIKAERSWRDVTVAGLAEEGWVVD